MLFRVYLLILRRAVLRSPDIGASPNLVGIILNFAYFSMKKCLDSSAFAQGYGGQAMLDAGCFTYGVP
jgi:hypothetical protein